ncbi:hypothetical protein SDJN02_17044 [Cucurbita argyrosperma subsp. argyrosperma]|nr:hypothetical protein SDJN02_17044 [Cucurbita argyrosperma subsp. argyrosperma]
MKLQDEIIKVEGRLIGDHDSSSFSDSVDTLIESQKELNSVKKALASTLRDTLALKRLLMTCQPKLNSSGLLFSYYPSCFPS